MQVTQSTFIGVAIAILAALVLESAVFVVLIISLSN